MHTEASVDTGAGEAYEDLSGKCQLVECAEAYMCLAVELTPNFGLA